MGKYKLYNQKLDILMVDLEMQRRLELNDLKMQFDITLDSVKPMNLIKDTISDFRQTPEVQTSLLGSALSIAGGYISKRLLFGNSPSFIKKALGYALQFGVTKLISKKVTEK